MGVWQWLFLSLSWSTPLIGHPHDAFAHRPWIDEDTAVHISQPTHAILNRYYIIARMKKAVTLLRTIPKDVIKKLDLAKITLTHTKAQRYVERIQKEKTIQPLYAYWNEISNYKAIDDEHFVHDFILLLFTFFTATLHEKQPLKHPHNTVHNHIPTSCIALRFYLINRMSSTYSMLLEYNKNSTRTTQKIVAPILTLFEQLHSYQQINSLSFITHFLHTLVETLCMLAQNNTHAIKTDTMRETLATIDQLTQEIKQKQKSNKKKMMPNTPQSITHPRCIDDQSTRDIDELIYANFGITPEQFCNYVYRRFYLINRLTNTINLFGNIQKKLHAHTYSGNPQSIFTFDSTVHFSNSRIQELIECLRNNTSFIPLFMVWQDFIAYKALDDQLFIEDFTKEIFIISKNIFLQTASEYVTHKLATQAIDALSMEQLLDEIDIFTDSITHTEKYHRPTSVQQLLIKIAQHDDTSSSYRDIKKLAHIDDVIIYFYYIQRLSKTIRLLSYLIEKKYHFHAAPIKKTNSCAIYDTVTFTHYKNIACIKAMNANHSVTPLLELLQEVTRYRHIQNSTFIKELLMLTTLTCKSIVEDTCYITDRNLKKSTLDTIISLGQKLDQLPISELLDTIDMLTEELPAFLEKYEFRSTLTWKAWLKKYWWIPPIILAWFGLKTIVKFQRKTYPYVTTIQHYKPHAPGEVYNDNDFINSLPSP